MTVVVWSRDGARSVNLQEDDQELDVFRAQFYNRQRRKCWCVARRVGEMIHLRLPE